MIAGPMGYALMAIFTLAFLAFVAWWVLAQFGVFRRGRVVDCTTNPQPAKLEPLHEWHGEGTHAFPQPAKVDPYKNANLGGEMQGMTGQEQMDYCAGILNYEANRGVDWDAALSRASDAVSKRGR